MTHHSSSVQQTEAIAADFAAALPPGTCIALEGDLGAGKTQFVRGIIRGLGGDTRAVSSPTYVLLHVYDHPPQRLPAYHLDAYRVHGPGDLEAIGFSELLDQNALVIVEWASRVRELLPAGTIHVNIRATGPSDREIEIVYPDM